MMSAVLNGLQWVLEDSQRREGGVSKAVANMSFGGGKSMALNQAVKSLVDEGLVVVVAAGGNSVGRIYPFCVGGILVLA